MGNILKKVISSFVALTTIAWSVGVGTFALPSAASAATAGDLIKASGPAVYYFAADGKRYVFPNEKTYFSWFMDFSGVRTISDSELASYLIGGNVTIRPGTKLVKIQTDPKVYAVTTGGILHWVESEAIATALYGSSWATRVVDVPDSFFVNYSIGSSVSSPVHPDGSLITYAGDPTRYVMAGGMKRKIASDAVFAANMFNPVNVITTTITYGNGTDVTSRECPLADVIPLCTGVPAIGGSLTATLASDTPAAATVPKNASSVPLVKYNFTAGSSAAMITGLRVHRVGVGAVTDFANVYLYDGNGNRLTTGRTINSSSNDVEFNGLSVNVAAGATVSLVLVGDFSNPTVTGGQHAFELTDASAVIISGAGTVSGSFPILGNVFTVGSISAGRLDVQKGVTPTNPNIGATNAEISNFKLTANTNDIEVRRITLLQAGSVSNSDLSNFQLYQGSTVVATAAAVMGDKIVLTFSPAYLITNGTTKTFSLHATIAGRSGRTIRTYVEYTTDVYAIDKLYNAGASVCISSSGLCSTGSFDGSGFVSDSNPGNSIDVTTQGGQLTVSFNGPVTGNIAKGSQDVVLYKFSLLSADNDLEIRNVDFILDAINGGVLRGSAGTSYFRDIKIKNLDTGETWMGPTDLPVSCGNLSTTCHITLTDSRNITAGQVYNLAITADLSNTEDADVNFFTPGTNQYRITLGDGTNIFSSSDVRIVSTGEFLPLSQIVPNTDIAGNPQTVKASNLSVAIAASPSATTAVKKQANIPTVGLVFTAGDQSDISLKSVKLTGSASLLGTTYDASTTRSVITACALFDGATQVGLSQAPDVVTGAMNITNMNVTVAKGTSKTLVAECTAGSTIIGPANYVAVGVANANDVVAEDADANQVTPSLSAQVIANAGATPVLIQTIRAHGSLTISPNNLRQSTILVGDGGAVWQNFAEFKATAQYEDVTIDKMTATSTGDAANFTMISVAKDGSVLGFDILPSGNAKSKDLTLTTPITVPKDGSATFQLWGKLANVVASSSVNGATAGAARSGNLMSLGLAAGITTGDWDATYAGQLNLRANGAASGDRLYAATTTAANMGNSFVLRKTKPVVTRQALSTTTLTSGLDMDLYKFQVSADSAGSVALKKIVFNVAESGAFTMSNFRLRKGSTDIALADAAITDGTGADLKAGTLSASGQVVVIFTNEETISGSGNVYTLHASIGGTVNSGDSVSINFATDNTVAAPVTGYLTNDTTVGLVGANLDTAIAPSGIASASGTFVWSDNSEVPHSYALGTAGGSRDWTQDLYVEDLTQQTTLSR
jgi:hypothetical protein